MGGNAWIIGPDGLDSALYDSVALMLGSSITSASLTLDDAFLEHRFSIDVAGSASIAAVGGSGS